MTPVIVPFYAALLILLFVALSLRVIRFRRRTGVPIGHGGQAVLERSARVHANFAEYVPAALILLGFVEAQGWPSLAIHVLCLALLAGRLSHAFGVAREPENFRFRVTGMALTFTVLGLASALLLVSPLMP